MTAPKDRALAALLQAEVALARLAAHERWPEAVRERQELGQAVLAAWEEVARTSEDLIDGRATPTCARWRAKDVAALASRLAERIGAGPLQDRPDP